MKYLPLLSRWVGVSLFLGSGLWARAANITGQFIGRVSGQPLAKAWVSLGRLTQGAEGKDEKIQLSEFSAVTDDSGRLMLANVPPGEYTFVYRPEPGGPTKGLREINVTKLSSLIRSFMPMMRDVEVGKDGSFAQRPWAEFTLLKGHTLYCITFGGAYMKIWNATVRSGRLGPYLEMRKGQIWRQNVRGDTSWKLEAWSY